LTYCKSHPCCLTSCKSASYCLIIIHGVSFAQGFSFCLIQGFRLLCSYNAFFFIKKHLIFLDCLEKYLILLFFYICVIYNMFHTFMFLYTIFLFVILTPGVVLRLPPRGSLLSAALVHGFIFSLICHLSYPLFF
jgi:hypothetical protein